MNIVSMAGKNLRKNASFYALYLFSTALVMMVFYAFTAFSMNQVMLEKISQNGRVESMCRVISGFLMVFVLFYMSTSNRFFLKRRVRELGIYALLGCRKGRIGALLAAESILLCLLGFILGTAAGAMLHKGIILGLTALLDLSINWRSIPFFQPAAAGQTAAFVLLVVLALTLSNGAFLRRASLLEFLRFEKKAEEPKQPRALPAFLGLALILLGYLLSLDILAGKDSLWFRVGFYTIGLLTLICVTVGTALFLSSFLPYFLRKRKRDIRHLYTPEGIILTPGFLYRVRTNAKTLIALTLLSAGVLTISSVMALTVSYPIAAVSRMAPSELEFRLEDEEQLQEVQTLVERYAPHASVSYLRTDLYHAVSTARTLPDEYSLGTSKGDAENEKLLRKPGFECISETNFRALLQAQGKETAWNAFSRLKEGECILVKYQPNRDGDETGAVYPLQIGGETVPVTVKAVTLDNPLSFANSVGTLVLSDGLYSKLRETTPPLYTVLSLNGEGLKDNEALYTALQKTLHDSPYLQGNSHRVHVIFSLNSSTFLLIGFLVVLFFIAVGSTLYFNNVSAVTDSREDYTILHKLGYSQKRLQKILRRQIFGFFSIPFLLGLLDCAFAVLVYRRALMQDLLGDSITQYIPVLLAVVLTAGIELIYYGLTVRACRRIIAQNMG